MPIVHEEGGAVGRQVAWGEMVVSYNTIPAGYDTSSAMKGLPDDRCPCPHWGYVIKGRARITYADHEEVISAGDLFYMPPGHLAEVDEDYEGLEYSPKDAADQMMALIMQLAASAEDSE